MKTRGVFGTMSDESTQTEIYILSGNPPITGNLVFFPEQEHCTRIVCVDVGSFTIAAPLPRVPKHGDRYDCGVIVDERVATNRNRMKDYINKSFSHE